MLAYFSCFFDHKKHKNGFKKFYFNFNSIKYKMSFETKDKILVLYSLLNTILEIIV